MDNGPEMISQALQQFCDGTVGLSYIPPGAPWDNAYIESFNSRLRKECLNRNHWTNLLEARVVIGDFKHEHNHRHRHSALGYLTPAEYAAQCSHTTPLWPAKSTESRTTKPDSRTGWTQYRGLATVVVRQQTLGNEFLVVRRPRVPATESVGGVAQDSQEHSCRPLWLQMCGTLSRNPDDDVLIPALSSNEEPILETSATLDSSVSDRHEDRCNVIGHPRAQSVSDLLCVLQSTQLLESASSDSDSIRVRIEQSIHQCSLDRVVATGSL
ncbi:hypothetical protein MBOT_27830 [Mycobacterium botniense]|uniref:Integrase catalytic domain-containing protein n=1 Tax=Mycobacterium botniense TaxID=84962 RepID=A0A7I9Y029_9MYCO|nr:hypothetical protein MBOT_27830 [Mycobacterium botniense]